MRRVLKTGAIGCAGLIGLLIGALVIYGVVAGVNKAVHDPKLAASSHNDTTVAQTVRLTVVPSTTTEAQAEAAYMTTMEQHSKDVLSLSKDIEILLSNPSPLFEKGPIQSRFLDDSGRIIYISDQVKAMTPPARFAIVHQEYVSGLQDYSSAMYLFQNAVNAGMITPDQLLQINDDISQGTGAVNAATQLLANSSP